MTIWPIIEFGRSHGYEHLVDTSIANDGQMDFEKNCIRDRHYVYLYIDFPYFVVWSGAKATLVRSSIPYFNTFQLVLILCILTYNF